jgi:hypothetical protein
VAVRRPARRSDGHLRRRLGALRRGRRRGRRRPAARAGRRRRSWGRPRAGRAGWCRSWPTRAVCWRRGGRRDDLLVPGAHAAGPREGLLDVRDNLIARIDEARREGWLGEVEGLQISLAQLDQITNPEHPSAPASQPERDLEDQVQRTRAGSAITQCAREALLIRAEVRETTASVLSQQGGEAEGSLIREVPGRVGARRRPTASRPSSTRSSRWRPKTARSRNACTSR